MPVVRLLSDHCENQQDMPAMRLLGDQCQHRPTAEKNNSASAVYQISTDHFSHQTTIQERPKRNDQGRYTLIEDFRNRNRSRLPARSRSRSRSRTKMTKLRQSSSEDSLELNQKLDSGSRVRKLRSFLRQYASYRPRDRRYVCQLIGGLNRSASGQKSNFSESKRVSNIYRCDAESSSSWEEEDESDSEIKEHDEQFHKPRCPQYAGRSKRRTPSNDLRHVSSSDDVESPNENSNKMCVMEVQKCEGTRERRGRERIRRQLPAQGAEGRQDVFICGPKVCRSKMVKPKNGRNKRSNRRRRRRLCCRSISPQIQVCEISGRDGCGDGTKTTLYLCSDASTSPVSGSSGYTCRASSRRASQDTCHAWAGENTFRLRHESRREKAHSNCHPYSTKGSPCHCCVQAPAMNSRDIVLSEQSCVTRGWKNVGKMFIELLRFAMKCSAVFALTCAALLVLMIYACTNYIALYCVLMVITLLLFILMTDPDSLLVYHVYRMFVPGL